MLLANIFHGDTTEQICAVIIKQNIAQPILGLWLIRSMCDLTNINV